MSRCVGETLWCQEDMCIGQLRCVVEGVDIDLSVGVVEICVYIMQGSGVCVGQIGMLI